MSLNVIITLPQWAQHHVFIDTVEMGMAADTVTHAAAGTAAGTDRAAGLPSWVNWLGRRVQGWGTEHGVIMGSEYTRHTGQRTLSDVWPGSLHMKQAKVPRCRRSSFCGQCDEMCPDPPHV